MPSSNNLREGDKVLLESGEEGLQHSLFHPGLAKAPWEVVLPCCSRHCQGTSQARKEPS